MHRIYATGEKYIKSQLGRKSEVQGHSDFKVSLGNLDIKSGLGPGMVPHTFSASTQERKSGKSL